MKKFILFTRGRTGSTAVIDELDKLTNISAAQELFLKYDFNKSDIVEHYRYFKPFIIWKQQNKAISWLPNSNWVNKYLAKIFLSCSERIAHNAETNYFGFKLLSHHFQQWPFLAEILLNRRYKVVYLTRNMARQVISGMVANMMGVYNSKEEVSDRRKYTIDLDDFEELIKLGLIAERNDHVLLTNFGFNFITVSYEDFIKHRDIFYKKIFEFLGMVSNLPPPSDYQVIIRDMKHTIENYDEVVERASKISAPLI